MNPVDHLWRHVKEEVLTNEGTPDLEVAIAHVCGYLQTLTPTERLRKAGILSGNFWPQKVL